MDDLKLRQLAAWLDAQGSDGRAGARAIMRDIEARYPGEIARMHASQIGRSLGIPPLQP